MANDASSYIESHDVRTAQYARHDLTANAYRDVERRDFKRITEAKASTDRWIVAID